MVLLWNTACFECLHSQTSVNYNTVTYFADLCKIMVWNRWKVHRRLRDNYRHHISSHKGNSSLTNYCQENPVWYIPKPCALLRVRLCITRAPKNDHLRRKSCARFFIDRPFCLPGWNMDSNSLINEYDDMTNGIKQVTSNANKKIMYDKTDKANSPLLNRLLPTWMQVSKKSTL